MIIVSVTSHKLTVKRNLCAHDILPIAFEIPLIPLAFTILLIFLAWGTSSFYKWSKPQTFGPNLIKLDHLIEIELHEPLSSHNLTSLSLSFLHGFGILSWAVALLPPAVRPLQKRNPSFSIGDKRKQKKRNSSEDFPLFLGIALRISQYF